MSHELKRKLKAAREKLQLSQSQFATQVLKIPVQTLQAWEIDRRTPRGFALAAINQILDQILSEA